MTCDLDRVDALADGRLDGPEAKEVMEHLAGCPQCRAYYEGALAADRVLADTGINPPADFAAGVMERIRPRRQVQWPRAAAGLAACLLLAAGAFPKVGVLKRAYRRVESGGPAFERDERAEKLVDVADVDESRASPAWNAVVPLAVLVGGTIIFDNDLIHGMVLAIIAQFLLYVPQKLMTVGRFFEHFFNGAKGMTSLAIVVCFGFVLSEANRQLGLFDILINGIGSTVPGYLVPPLAFLLVGATVFAVGGCWVVMTIAIPVFVPLALSMGVTAPVIIAAVMSGIGLGYSTCFYADAVFMTTAGTGVSNITIIKAALPYAAGAAAVAAAGFLLCGILA